MTDPPADAANLLPSRMKMADVKVGDRLVSTIAGGPAFSPITVTEITARGFRYKLDAPVCLHPLMGTTDSGEHFGHDGECFYEPDTRPQPASPDARMEAVFKAAIALSRQWNLEGGKFDEALFGKVEDLHKAICGLYDINPIEGFNARDLTQPAPPAGEPDFYELAHEFLRENALGLHSVAAHIERIWRLGLAARPKVEDAAEPDEDLSRYEHGFNGHGRGLVITQPESGKFVERPMTAGELAARLPANLIAVDIHKLGTYAAFAYVKTWEIIAPAIDRAISKATKAAEAKLAEREAELAKADAVIFFDHAKERSPMPPFYGNACEDACVRHAARQQQKASAEPTAQKENGK